MKKRNFKDLYERYQCGECTPEESSFVEHYILFEEENGTPLSDDELKIATSELQERIDKIPFKRSFPMWPKLIAASVLLFSLCYLVYVSQHRVSPILNDREKTDISPGKYSATLALSNGKKFNLSAAKTGVIIDAKELTYNDGTAISTNQTDKKSELVTISTPMGGTYQVILPDQTKVWLNAASKIIFPTTFAGLHKREVEIIGEAYFEVAKDKIHPFIVKTNKQEVQVVGTHFNITNYPDESEVKTILLEGSVKVTALSLLPGKKINAVLNNIVFLKPGQESTLHNQFLSVAPADVADAVAWKNGRLVFTNESLESILRKISRWYDVEIVYKGPISKDLAMTGSISRSKPLSAILETIEKTKKVKFKVQGRRIMVN